MVALSLLFSSCNCVSSFLAKAPAPKGTVDEQISYHQEQIRKYKTKVNQEEHNEHRALSKSELSEVKRANQRKAKYVEKIEEHAKELERLRVDKKGVAMTLIAIPTNSCEAEIRQAIKYVESEISSTNQLREYYIKKAGQARERAKYLQYKGYLMASSQQFYMAATYDAIVLTLERKLGRLQLQKDDLVRRSTNFYWTPPPPS